MPVKISCLLFVLAVFMFAGIGFAASGFVANTSGCGATGIINGLIDEAARENNGSTSNWTFNKSGVTTPVFNQTGTGACINIQTSDVEFDLNGSIIQLSNGAASPPDDNSIYGILITNGSNNVTIKNGYINMSDNRTINATVNFYGIRVNGSANVTIVNVSITSFGYDPGGTDKTVISVAINITNVSHNSGGFVNITNVSISNVTTGGIKIENSTGVNISYVMFNAGGSPWNNAAYAIGATNQNATEFVNVTYSLFNSSTNISILFYSNLSIYLQPTRPIAAGPTGAYGGTRTYLDKMINLTGSSTATAANLTFWFNTTNIATAPDTTRLAVYKTTDSATWSSNLTTLPWSAATTSITVSNLASFSAFVLFGDITTALASTYGCGATGVINGLVDAAAVSNNGSTTNWTFNKSGVTTPVFNQTGTGACINIQTSDIVFDLNGSIIQLSNGAGSPPDDNSIYGILITNGSNNITIMNGYINMSDNRTINATVNFYGIRVNGSANVTIVNVSITSFGYDPGGTDKTVISVAINITNVSHNSGGFVNITNVSISNVTTGGIKIENSTGVNISYVMFNAGGSPWNTAAYAIGATNQNATEFVNVTYSLFNSSTNISILFYSNLSIYLQPTRPISTAPTGTSNSNGARTFLDKMINLTGASAATSANLTFWFNTTNIVNAPDTTRMAIYKTTDSVSWSAALTAIPWSAASTSITVSNLASFSAFVLFGDTGTDTAHPLGPTNANSGRLDVPTPTLGYSCENNQVTVRTLPDLGGGSVRMQYYCGTASCGACDASKVGAYLASIASDGTVTFDYFGAGEYQFEVTAVGSSTTYRPTSWYNSGWSCYKPDAGCAVAEQPVSVPVAEPLVTEQPAAEQPAPQPEQPTASTAREGALNAISDASNAIEVAQNANRNIAPARQKLQEASTAFASEDYSLATELANAAVQLAQAAPAKPSAPAAAQVPTAPKPVQAAPAPNNTMLYLGVIVLVVVIAAAYLLFGKGKAKKGI